jgi:tetratricopeptide (TPR) repeat protein
MAESLDALIDRAIQFHTAGQFEPARQIYEQILVRQPAHPPALHLLGVLKSQAGDRRGGAEMILQAIRLNPNVSEFHANLALVYIEDNRPGDALPHAQRAVELNPQNLDALNHRANAKRMLGRLDEAINEFLETLRFKPDFYDALHNLSLALTAAGRVDEAAAYGERAALLRTPDAKTLLHLGQIAQRQKRFDAAVNHYTRAIAAEPTNPDAPNALGTAYFDMKRYDEAQANYRRALELDPRHAGAHNNLGLLLAVLGRHREALEHYLQSVDQRPDSPETLNNLANAYRDLLQFDQARAAYDRALVFRADYPDAHWNRSLLDLLLGRFETAWRDYEWRWVRFPNERRGNPQPRWDGYDIRGKTILLQYEQGLGDTLQFARYATIVARETGATVILECQPELVPVLKNIDGVSQIIGRGDPLPPFDVYCPLLSVTIACGTTSLDRIPRDVPYVKPEPAAVERWKPRLGERDGRRRIGLCWSGSTTHSRDLERSIALSRLAPILATPDTRFISLQKNPRPGDVPALKGSAIEDFTADFVDFADTAAVVEQLDLVITVDTSIAHLAGAMGKTVWLLLPTNPDWRWLLGRDDSPWYPTIRLFRQSSAGDWDGVIRRVADALTTC